MKEKVFDLGLVYQQMGELTLEGKALYELVATMVEQSLKFGALHGMNPRDIMTDSHNFSVFLGTLGISPYTNKEDLSSFDAVVAHQQAFLSKNIAAVAAIGAMAVHKRIRICILIRTMVVFDEKDHVVALVEIRGDIKDDRTFWIRALDRELSPEFLADIKDFLSDFERLTLLMIDSIVTLSSFLSRNRVSDVAQGQVALLH